MDMRIAYKNTLERAGQLPSLMLARAATRTCAATTVALARRAAGASRRLGMGEKWFETSHSGPAKAQEVDRQPFTELGITEQLFTQVGGGKKFRQHVNPLKRSLATPPALPDWECLYDDPSLPLVVDVGSGYGRFLLGIAQRVPGRNHFGFEIREQVRAPPPRTIGATPPCVHVLAMHGACMTLWPLLSLGRWGKVGEEGKSRGPSCASLVSRQLS